MARSTSTPSAASGGGSSKKRKVPTTSSSSSTPGTPAATATSSTGGGTSSKKAKLEQARARARAWAEEEKRKKAEKRAAANAAAATTPSAAAAKRSAAPTPPPASARRRRGAGAGGSRASTPSTSDAEMEEAEETRTTPGTKTPATASSRTTPTTATSRRTPTAGTVTVKKSRTPGTDDSTLTKKQKLLAGKEKARQWAVKENIIKPRHIKSPPSQQPTTASSSRRTTTTPRRPPPMPHAPSPGNGSSAAYIVLSDDENEEVEEEHAEESPPSPAQKISHILTGEGGGGGRGTTTATATIPMEYDDEDRRDVGPTPVPSSSGRRTVLEAASAAVVGSHPKTEEVEDREGEGPVEGGLSGETGKFLERAERAYRVGLSILRLTMVAIFLGCALYAWSVVYGNVARQMRRAEDGILMGGAARLHHHRRAPKYCYLDSSSPKGAGGVKVDEAAEAETGGEGSEGVKKKEEEDGVQKCARTKPYPPVVPCPPRGVCRDGEWIDCHPSSLFVRNVEAGVCSLTDAATTQLGQAEMVLSRWTSQAVCGAPKGEEMHRRGRRDDGGAETLWFDVNDLATEILVLDQQSAENGTAVPTSSFPDRVAVISDILVTIISHLYEDKSPSAVSPTVKLSADLDEVALTETGMAMVDYPWACWSLIWLRHLTKCLLGWSWRGMESLAALCVAQPKACAAFVVVAYLVLLVVRRRRRKERLRADTEEAKAIAYEKLVGVAEENDNGNDKKPEPYPSQHLRTDVANDMYPRSRKDREGYFAKEVWPRVLVEIRSDVRIEKCQMNVGSTPQECWVWLGNKGSSASTPASHARRERGGTGTGRRRW